MLNEGVVMRLRVWGQALFVVFSFFLSGLLSGCGRSSGATDIAGQKPITSVPSLIGVQGGVIRSSDQQARVVFPADAIYRDMNLIVRAISGVPSGNVGPAYGIEVMESGGVGLAYPATVDIAYAENLLPLGTDEADLTLGVVVNHRWRPLPGVRVDVVSNTVKASLKSLDSIGVFGILIRPYPVVLNPSFDIPVLEGKSAAGWQSISQSPGAGGGGNINGNRFFIINSAGQADSDPSIHQIVTGLSPGRRYAINGLFAGVGDCCGNPSALSFGVAVDGQIVLERSRPLGEGFVPFSATLLATSVSHDISFIAERNGEDIAYAIDDITIVPVRGFNLTIDHKSRSGGTILSYPGGIDCGKADHCFASFASGSRVTLVANVDDGFAFSGFSGEGCLGSLTCTVTMDHAKTVTATFSFPSKNAALLGFSTFSRLLGHPDVRFEPAFDPDILAYKAQRVEPGLITFVASTAHPGAVISITERTEVSGQPFSVYFNGIDVAVPVEVTAQDGKTKNIYTVSLCRWYCQDLQTRLSGSNTL